MKQFLKICLTCVPVILAGCRSTRPLIYIGGFDFEYKKEKYRIESVTPNFREGYNLLLQKAGEEILFMAIDQEQDGFLDSIKVGDIPLETARTIYAEGLSYGHRRGFIKDRILTREYRTSVDITNYVLVTYVLAMGDLYNKFYIRDITRKESVLIDIGADGVLDHIEEGTRELEYYQSHYKIVLNRGVNAGKIVKTDSRFIVQN